MPAALEPWGCTGQLLDTTFPGRPRARLAPGRGVSSLRAEGRAHCSRLVVVVRIVGGSSLSVALLPGFSAPSYVAIALCWIGPTPQALRSRVLSFRGPRARDFSSIPGFLGCAAASVPQSLRQRGKGAVQGHDRNSRSDSLRTSPTAPSMEISG